MPIYTRFCPVDWHTCSRRECQDPADCQYPPQPTPQDPQKVWDELHPPSAPELSKSNFCSFCQSTPTELCCHAQADDFSSFDDPVDGPVDRVFQRFLDVLTGVRSSAECPTLEELQL